MIAIATSEARRQFSEILSRVAYGHERVVLHRNGRNLAAMVSMADLQSIESATNVETARTAIPQPRLESSTNNPFTGGVVMSHTRDTKKEEKKTATKSIKERRAEKKAKKAAKGGY